MKIENEGFHEMSASDYHSDPCPTPSLSSSTAWDIEASNVKAGTPKHAWLYHPKLGGVKKEASDSMRFGSLCHSLFLGVGSDFEISPYDDFRKKEAKEWRDSVESQGKIAIKKDEHDKAIECVTAWKQQFALTSGTYESVVTWKEGDLWCRSMLDIFMPKDGYIWDLKTTTSVHPKKIMRKVADEGLHLRSEFYTRGIEKIMPELAGKVRFGFIFASIVKPYLVLVVERLNGQFRHVGKMQVQRSIETFSKCLKENNWPGYEPIQQLECPRWTFMEEIEEEDNE